MMKNIFIFWVSSSMLAVPQGLSVQSNTAFVAAGNPIIKHKFITDPAAMVHDGKMYIYGGHDECSPSEEHYDLKEWCVFSSSGLKTWTEHAVPLKAKDFSWAKSEAWASQVIEHDGKFYWYVTVKHKTIPGKPIGVAVSDSPTGPFVSARGSALIINDMTTDRNKGYWDDIDPTVFIDDDGRAYLYWGDSQCYFAKLKKNMVELDGPTIPVDLPCFTEAPWIHKKGDWYYLPYAPEFPEKTCYVMSRSITDPWEYKGILNELARNSNMNHQAIIELKDNRHFIYHNGGINPTGGSFRRSVCMERLYYNEDGTMKRI